MFQERGKEPRLTRVCGGAASFRFSSRGSFSVGRERGGLALKARGVVSEREGFSLE